MILSRVKSLDEILVTAQKSRRWKRPPGGSSQERVARSWLDPHANAFENNAS
jgi:hypothetical protein